MGSAARAARRAVTIWSVLGGLLVIGAGLNGASFLDFGGNISSLIMAVLSFAAVACFSIALFLLGAPGASLGPAAGTGARQAADQLGGGPGLQRR